MMYFKIIAIGIFVSLVGCSQSAKELGEAANFTGQAVFASGAPVPNVLVVLQPLEQGYEIELETDSEGQFKGEGLPGKYVYYFADSKQQKSVLPKTFPVEYRDPRKEHVVTLQSNQHVVCAVNQ